MGNPQSPTVDSAGDSAQGYAEAWMGGKFGGEWIYLCVAQSLCCAPETIKTLLIGYTPILNKLKKNKGRTTGIWSLLYKYLISLCLSFFICQMEMTISTSSADYDDHISQKCLKQCLIRSKHCLWTYHKKRILKISNTWLTLQKYYVCSILISLLIFSLLIFIYFPFMV